MNDEAVYRTAPATPGLLKMTHATNYRNFENKSTPWEPSQQNKKNPFH